ncbi:hypothetical protein QBC39DRAFT_336176 [Podospora conica]|nr:hypothetical protein QBC39DRAFT_336176 [Schizothecium conicum]
MVRREVVFEARCVFLIPFIGLSFVGDAVICYRRAWILCRPPRRFQHIVLVAKLMPPIVFFRGKYECAVQVSAQLPTYTEAGDKAHERDKPRSTTIESDVFVTGGAKP